MEANSDSRQCFDHWIALQESALDELLHAPSDEAELRALVDKNISHFEAYVAQRRALSSSNAASFFAPPWCATFENSLLWIGGCRPTLYIRMIYALSSINLSAHIRAFLSEADVNGAFAPGGVRLTAEQLSRVNGLHGRTLAAENRLSSQMATLQEDVGDKPIVTMVKERSEEMVDEMMDGFEGKLAEIMGVADELRIGTLRELVTEILTPVQAVEVLATAKQLQLSLHKWGCDRDSRRGQA